MNLTLSSRANQVSGNQVSALRKTGLRWRFNGLDAESSEQIPRVQISFAAWLASRIPASAVNPRKVQMQNGLTVDLWTVFCRANRPSPR